VMRFARAQAGESGFNDNGAASDLGRPQNRRHKRACQSVFLISGLIGILCESDFGSVPHLIAFVTQLQLGARTEIRGNVVCGGEAISAYRSV